MKNLFFIISLLCLIQNVCAQYFSYRIDYENLEKYTILDSAYLKCSYKLSYLQNDQNPNVVSTDIQILLIGRNISKYYSQYALDYNNFITDYLKKGHDAYPNPKEKGAWSFEVFKNYPREKETVTDIASLLSGNFYYEEDLPFFGWKIYDEKQNILSYTCQKATVSFRGRDFTAWFTADIPLPNGPWKFGGLPGLILKLYDSENNFIFECIGLEYLKQKEPIKFYQVEYEKVIRNDLMKTYKRFHEDFVGYMNTLGIEVDISNGSSTLKLPYNPIELE